MQGVQSTTRISPPTKAVSKKAPSPKASKEKDVVHKAKLPSSGSKLSNPGPHQSSYIESNLPRKKRVISEHIQGVTDLKILPTPINLYEDECAFCHSFRTTTTFHGPMVRYLMGRIVSSDEGSPSNVIYVHMKCLDWAPQVWFEGDTVMNLEPEIRRASRLRCHRCGIRGAALGCYYEHCNKSFHVPCAVQIYGCRWDVDGRYVLCPEHVSKMLPCDNLSSQTKERQKLSSFSQSQFSHKEESFESFEGEGQQIHQLNTGNSFLPLSQYSVKVENFDGYDEEDQQTDHLNASNSSSFPQSQSSQKEAFSTHNSREGKKIDQHTASSSSSLRLSCCADEEEISNACQSEEMKTDLQQTSSYPSDKLVLLGSLLSASEKDSLEDFACWTNATVTNEWGENVTHVIVGKYAGSAWSRSYEVLMAILFGKWVVQTQWFVNCLGMRPDREDSYEVTCSDDSDRPLDGPKKGRTRAAEGAPKLFSGLHFCLSECMSPGDSGRLRKLIAAAGGRVLEPSSSLQWRSLRGDSSPRPYFVFNGSAPEEFRASSLRMEVKEAMEHRAAGARVVGHLTVLHAVAAYDADVLDRKGRLCA